MTDQEKANKKEARRLIKLPLDKRPDNVKYIEGTLLNHTGYEVYFGDIRICFMQTEKQLVYLGEYPTQIKEVSIEQTLEVIRNIR